MFVDWFKMVMTAGVAVVACKQLGYYNSTVTTLMVAAGAAVVLRKCCLPNTRFARSGAAANFDKKERELDAKYEAVGTLVKKHIGAKHTDDEDQKASTVALSNLYKAGFVCAADCVRDNAEKLWYIHGRCAAEVNGGMAVKLSAGLNLFCGTVANLGSKEQCELLDKIMKKGELGSFAVTEVGAGVLSGLIIETTARWTKDGFVLHTPTPTGRKTWISQGLTGVWSVVVARLILPDATAESKEKDFGPHAFLVYIPGLKGLTITDMERKTQFNNLDNVYMEFTNCTVPHSSMLTGISSVSSEGKYALADPKVPFRFEHVAQRLLSGRLCISIASMGLLSKTVNQIRAYTREVPTGKDKTTPLPKLPIIRDMLDEADRVKFVLAVYSNAIFDKFSKADQIQGKMVDQIACAKILNVGFAIDMSLKLKGKIGAWALQESGPFGGQTDLLYVFQFAEGDSGILKQKMARDLLTQTIAKPQAVLGHVFSAIFGTGIQRRQSRALLSLAYKMAGAKGPKKVTNWLDNHKLVEEVAMGHCVLTVRKMGLGLGVGSKDRDAFDNWFKVNNEKA